MCGGGRDDGGLDNGWVEIRGPKKGIIETTAAPNVLRRFQKSERTVLRLSGGPLGTNPILSNITCCVLAERSRYHRVSVCCTAHREFLFIDYSSAVRPVVGLGGVGGCGLRSARTERRTPEWVPKQTIAGRLLVRHAAVAWYGVSVRGHLEEIGRAHV